MFSSQMVVSIITSTKLRISLSKKLRECSGLMKRHRHSLVIMTLNKHTIIFSKICLTFSDNNLYYSWSIRLHTTSTGIRGRFWRSKSQADVSSCRLSERPVFKLQLRYKKTNFEKLFFFLETLGLCQLNNNCANRYDNLLSTRRSLKGENSSKVTEKSMEIIFRIDPDWVPPTTPPSPPSSSASGNERKRNFNSTVAKFSHV